MMMITTVLSPVKSHACHRENTTPNVWILFVVFLSVVKVSESGGNLPKITDPAHILPDGGRPTGAERHNSAAKMLIKANIWMYVFQLVVMKGKFWFFRFRISNFITLTNAYSRFRKLLRLVSTSPPIKLNLLIEFPTFGSSCAKCCCRVSGHGPSRGPRQHERKPTFRKTSRLDSCEYQLILNNHSTHVLAAEPSVALWVNCWMPPYNTCISCVRNHFFFDLSIIFRDIKAIQTNCHKISELRNQRQLGWNAGNLCHIVPSSATFFLVGRHLHSLACVVIHIANDQTASNVLCLEAP